MVTLEGTSEVTLKGTSVVTFKGTSVVTFRGTSVVTFKDFSSVRLPVSSAVMLINGGAGVVKMSSGPSSLSPTSRLDLKYGTSCSNSKIALVLL